MAHKMLRSEFLGKTLERGSQLTAPKLPAKQQTQALFGGGGRKKKAGGGAQQAKRAADKAKQQLGSFGQKAKKQTQRQAPKAPSLPSPKKATTQIKRSLPSGGRGSGKKGWFGASESRNLSKFYGPGRDLFLPGGLLEREDVKPWLDGSRAGDYGWDPLGLGRDPAALEKFTANELINGRWAMLAAAGIIIPEGLQANGADLKGGTWFETGAEMLDGGTLNYFAVPWFVINNPLPLFVVAAIEVVLVGATEGFRGNGTGPPGYAPRIGNFDSSVFNGRDQLYPGGPFDPLGLADDPEAFEELKVKEIKNARLAMTSIVGFAAQGYVTGEGPYANWAKHVSDPFGYNLLTILGNEDRIPTL